MKLFLLAVLGMASLLLSSTTSHALGGKIDVKMVSNGVLGLPSSGDCQIGNTSSVTDAEKCQANAIQLKKAWTFTGTLNSDNAKYQKTIKDIVGKCIWWIQDNHSNTTVVGPYTAELKLFGCADFHLNYKTVTRNNPHQELVVRFSN